MLRTYGIYRLSDGHWYRPGDVEIFGPHDWALDTVLLLSHDKASNHVALLNDKTDVNSRRVRAVRVSMQAEIAEKYGKEIDSGTLIMNIDTVIIDYTDTME